MAIICGGVLEAWGPPRIALAAVMDEVQRFAPPADDGDYVVDIAMRSWHNFREAEFDGVRPGPVGRTQRRFIVWHSVPLGLETEEGVRRWLADALVETARLVREHLPAKSRAYPAEELAAEVDALRASLLADLPPIEAPVDQPHRLGAAARSVWRRWAGG